MGIVLSFLLRTLRAYSEGEPRRKKRERSHAVRSKDVGGVGLFTRCCEKKGRGLGPKKGPPQEKALPSRRDHTGLEIRGGGEEKGKKFP